MKNGILFLAFGMFFLASCGNESSSNAAETETTTEIESMVSTEADNTDASGNSVTLELTGDDQMRYNKKELKVKAGQKVTLNFKHIGKMKLEVMGHNFVLLVPGTDITAFGTEAAKAKENGYIPEGTDAVIVHTDMIGGGESTSITFDAPEKGVYDYICSFPAHFALMQGKFIVE